MARKGGIFRGTMTTAQADALPKEFRNPKNYVFSTDGEGATGAGVYTFNAAGAVVAAGCRGEVN